ncbi:MAG: hypothetical protein AB7T37_00735 [Dehalococcoidia bacterium]
MPATTVAQEQYGGTQTESNVEDAQVAISLGCRTIEKAGSADPYSLVAAEWLLGGTGAFPGLRTWKLTFKRTRLIPTAEQPRAGAGGEVTVYVDLDTRACAVGGAGE